MRQYQIPTDQLVKYQASVHGQRLINDKDVRVAICIDCHGSHDVKKASDPTAAVYPLNVPKLCASCHADATKMKPYGIPTNQYDLYTASVHGKALLECAGPARPDLRLVPWLARREAAQEHRGGPGLRQVPHRHRGALRAEQALAPGGGAEVLDLPRESRRRPAGRVALLPSDRTSPSTAPPVTTRPIRRSSSTPTASPRMPIVGATRATTARSQIYAQAQGIHDALDHGQPGLPEARRRGSRKQPAAGMIVTDADVELTEARTSLIRARAAVHTTKLTTVAELADGGGVEGRGPPRSSPTRASSESIFRREAMVVVVAIILVNVVLLYLLQRRIERGRGTEP